MICKWNNLDSNLQKTIEKVFWATSLNNNFIDNNEKNNYYNRWLGNYLKYANEFIYTWIYDNKIIAYIVGIDDRKKLIPFEETLNKSESVFFSDLSLDKYSAHFHLNSLPEFQGKGIGSKLLDSFEQDIKARGGGGIYLITTKGNKNNYFYLKNGYIERVTRVLGNKELIFFCKDIC